MTKELKHPSPDEIIIRLKKLIKKIENFQSEVKKGEVTHSQARILFPIVKAGKGFSMQELAEYVGVNKSLVSRTIADLETKGIVERDKKEGSNERNYKINLTDKGKIFFAEKMAKVEDMAKNMLGGITIEELLSFKKVLDKLTS